MAVYTLLEPDDPEYFNQCEFVKTYMLANFGLKPKDWGTAHSEAISVYWELLGIVIDPEEDAFIFPEELKEAIIQTKIIDEEKYRKAMELNRCFAKTEGIIINSNIEALYKRQLYGEATGSQVRNEICKWYGLDPNLID
ncbi:hypothetical protein [Paenibacillus luteus]|uniref:hypothetical protein n=1 Tax=Paenibacillus luteus TaxID=2545753 RepID=UPI001141E30F|nr:hypothetical protein [Paenibacillus luteus]